MNNSTCNNNFKRPVSGYCNTNYCMFQLGGSWNSNHYIIENRTGEIIAAGKRKRVVEVWNNVGSPLTGRQPMARSV